MTNDEFVEVVKETIQSLPDEFRSKLENIAIIIEERPRIFENKPFEHKQLLGLYQGVPRTVRFSSISLPDKITIYKKPLLSISPTLDIARKNIKDTVLHEIGHYFGLSDLDLYRIKNHIS